MKVSKLICFFMVNCMLLTKLPLFSWNSIFHYEVEEAEKPVVNPLKGWAPWIDDEEPVYPVSLVYVRMHWSEIEPEEDVYCFEQFEEENHMKEWREKGVRFVIRIVCDTPSGESHMDIPRWLYRKTNRDGDWYENSYGRGYSPNYGNPVFIEEHTELIAALAEYYADDPQVAFIQLGSLGHWGEWHVKSPSSIRQFPSAAIYNKYVQAYLDVFPVSKLMIRRPVDIAAENNIGLYNDSFGVTESHEEWLDWIDNGYYSSQSKEALNGMPDFWKTAASAGEFATTYDESYYFSEGYEETMRLIKESHTTFLGPRSGANVEEEYLKDEILAMSSEMGYCFQLSDVSLQKLWWNPNYLLSLNIANIGVAPFYENWLMALYIYDENQEIVYEKTYDVNLPSLLPGKHKIKINLEDMGLSKGSYTMAVGLIDPLTGVPGVSFANQSDMEDEYLYKVMEFSIK